VCALLAVSKTVTPRTANNPVLVFLTMQALTAARRNLAIGRFHVQEKRNADYQARYQNPDKKRDYNEGW